MTNRKSYTGFPTSHQPRFYAVPNFLKMGDQMSKFVVFETISTIIIIIIQHLYSALKSCKEYGGAGGFRLRLSEQVCCEVF